MLELLDDQLRWLMRHGYMTWHCYRCKMTFNTNASAYYHLVDHHELDPQSAFREGEAGTESFYDTQAKLGYTSE